MGATEILADFAVAGTKVAPCHMAEVARALIDTVAVTLGGAGDPGEEILRSWSRSESSAGPATLWTSGEKASASVAALVNGTVAHILDFDDISPSMPLHPSAVLMPALVAAAESWGGNAAQSERFAQAYVVGAAAFRALADILPQHAHYARGWHSTSTIGRLACVAALSTLGGFDPATARHALGIVASLAAGSRVNFGSMTKSLHAGAAARDALMAVELARAGFTANPEELETPGGFLERYGEPSLAPAGSVAQTLEERLDYWREAWVSDWGIKRYASCYGTHRGIDAMLAIRAQRPHDTPVAVHATLHTRGTRPLRKSPPRTATEAKFSLEYILAVAYLRGRITLDDFTAEAFNDQGVHELMGAVTVGEADVPPVGPAEFSTGFTVVEVTFADGQTLSARVDVTHGQYSDPLSDEELREKVIDCVSAGGYEESLAEKLISVIDGRLGPAFTDIISRRIS